MMLKTYAQHVADLLEEYKQLAHGKIIVEQYDPKPDSDAEDSARLDGVEGQLLPFRRKILHGPLRQRCSIARKPFRSSIPNASAFSEYDLSRAISRVVHTR